MNTSYINDYKEYRQKPFSFVESLIILLGYVLPFFLKAILFSFFSLSNNVERYIQIAFLILPLLLAGSIFSTRGRNAIEQPIVQWFIIFYGFSLAFAFIPDFPYKNIIETSLKLIIAFFLLFIDKDLVSSFRTYHIVDEETVIKKNFFITMLIYLGVAVGAYIVFIILTIILAIIYKIIGTQDNPSNQESIENSFRNGDIFYKISTFVSIVAIAPLTEEFMLRRGLFHSYKNKWVGIAVGSFMFALLHVTNDVWLFFTYFTSSLVWSSTLIFFRSALPGAISHSLSNFISSLSLAW